MNSKIYWSWIVIFLTIATLVFIDTRPYYKALNQVAKKSFKTQLLNEKKLIDQDLDLYFECNNIRINNSFSEKKENILYRNCLNKNILKINTLQGALIFSASASAILIKNPKDLEIKKNALMAIDLARIHMITIKPLEYDIMDNVNKSHDKSIILSFINGKKFTSSFFEVNNQLLNRAETYIISPETIIKQNTFSKGVV